MSQVRMFILIIMVVMIWQPITAQAIDADLQLVIHAPQMTWYVGEQVLITAEIENISANRAEGSLDSKRTKTGGKVLQERSLL